MVGEGSDGMVIGQKAALCVAGILFLWVYLGHRGSTSKKALVLDSAIVVTWLVYVAMYVGELF